MDTSAYGDPDTILYTFKVWDHRTEGRIHMNKRDLELYKKDEKSSYGRTQGDAALEGAVYGLFAAQDIIHPDGKSGVVYNQNDLPIKREMPPSWPLPKSRGQGWMAAETLLRQLGARGRRISMTALPSPPPAKALARSPIRIMRMTTAAAGSGGPC